MLDTFVNWLEDVKKDAIAWKENEANEGKVTHWKKAIRKSPNKNEEIKAKFRNEMFKLENNGEQVYFSYPSHIAKTGEWLYDFVARKLDNRKELIEVFLAMEIELSDSSEIGKKRDFNKLLQADSRYKIFVFQVKNKDVAVNAMKELRRVADKYHFRSNSDYLLCGWLTSENEFYYEKYKAIRKD